jgi:hypothetical protein
VILSEIDKEDLEQDIANSCIDTKGSTVIVRNGYSHIQSDLHKVRPQLPFSFHFTSLHFLSYYCILIQVSATAARSIIILSSVGMDTDSADVDAARTVLNLRATLKDDTSHSSTG